MSARAFRDALQQALQARGWRDSAAQLADALLVAVSVQRPAQWRDLDLEALVPDDFFIANTATAGALASLLEDRLGAVPEVALEDAGLETITIDEIDSFAKVREITAGEV